MKILFITNIPSPYRVDFFNELGKSCHLTVEFERRAAKDRNRNWKSDEFCNFEAIFLHGIEIGTDASISYQIIPIIRRGYDIVILNGYASPTYAIAMEYMKMNSIPFLLNADGGFIKKDKRVVYRLKRHLIGMPEAWLSTGRMTDDYLVHYGADRQNIYRYPFTSFKEQERYLPSEYEKAENDFYVMKQEIIEKFNAIYTGNTALSTAICNINLGNTTIQHFVKCNTEEFNDADLTIFFINTLNNLIEDNEPIIYVSIVDIGLNKVISIKTSLAHDFSTVERDNHRFIKKYNLKVDKEEKKITFLHLNPK